MSEVEIYKNIVQLLGGEDDDKLQALDLMRQLLRISKDSGYDLIVLKELIKIVQFDSSRPLCVALSLLEEYYFNQRHWDELAKTIIYRVGHSTDLEVSKHCLEALCSLLSHMGEDVAKHSNQILKLIDLNTSKSLNPINLKILKQLQSQLPQRLDHTCSSCGT